jgi:hypothetical protein
VHPISRQPRSIGKFLQLQGLRQIAGASFADAEAREDLAEQIVRTELAGDAGECVLSKPQLFGKELPR